MPTRKRWLGVAAWMLAVVPCRAADITAIVGATVVHPDRDLPSAVAPRLSADAESFDVLRNIL